MIELISQLVIMLKEGWEMSCKSVGVHELQNQLIIFKSLKSTVESISITQFLQVLLMLNDEFQK